MRLPSLRPDGRRAALAALYAFCLFAVYGVVTPLFEASDELWHYPMVLRMARGEGLPVQRAGQSDADAPWRQQGSQPPLYYAVAGLITAPIDQSNWRDIRRISPHADMGVPRPDGNATTVLNSPADDWPWRNAALGARLARLVSTLFSAATVAFVYLAAIRLFPGAPGLPGVVALFAASIPMFGFISGSVNNDNAAVFFCALGFWFALRLADTAGLHWRDAALAGLIAGLGALSKSSAMGLLGLLGLAACLSVLRSGALRAQLGRLSGWLLLMGLVFAAVTGWWFVRNVQLYGDLLGWNGFLDVVGRRDQPATLSQLWTEGEGFVWSFWGVFGTVNVIFPPWVYTALNALGVVALCGTLPGLWRLWRGRAPVNLAHGALTLVWIGVIFVALIRWTTLTPASQGRLMFPALTAIAAVLGWGLWQWGRPVAWLGVGAVALAAWLAPFAVIAPAYARPVDGWTQTDGTRVSASLGDGALVLDRASFDRANVSATDRVMLTLNWRLDRPLSSNHSVFVHLIDENDTIVAQRDMYPGQGTLALAEQLAGYRWTDRYSLRIPRFAPSGRALRWAVGVYDASTSVRLKTPDGVDRVIFAGPQLTDTNNLVSAYRYENGVKLLGLQSVPTAVGPGATHSFASRWQIDTAVPGDANVSVQIIDAAGNKAAQQDLPLGAPGWPVGQVVSLTHTLVTRADAPSGVYRLLLTVYVPEGDFKKIRVFDETGQYAGEETVITQVRVR
jgi:4-amino-4-deoxy-L-arabinose transferase-like glycosyltransferase